MVKKGFHTPDTHGIRCVVKSGKLYISRFDLLECVGYFLDLDDVRVADGCLLALERVVRNYKLKVNESALIGKERAGP